MDTAADQRNQVLENAKFVYGPYKDFKILQGRSDDCCQWQAILVEIIDGDTSTTFATRVISIAKETPEDALVELHDAVANLVFEKIATNVSGWSKDDMLGPGEAVIKGSLDW